MTQIPNVANRLNISLHKFHSDDKKSLSARSGLDQPVSLEKSLSARGLQKLRLTTEPVTHEAEITLDSKTEDLVLEQLQEICSTEGFNTSKCNPWENSSPHHQVFCCALRFNSNAAVKLILFDFCQKNVIRYLNDEEHSAVEIPLSGSKVAADLISKVTSHLWATGQKDPIEHVFFSEKCRDHMIEVCKLRQKEPPPITFVCVHSGRLQKKGSMGLIYNSRFCRLVDGQLLIYKSEQAALPVDAVYLMDTKVQRSGSVFVMSTPDREFTFKADSDADGKRWLRAIEVASARAQHEWHLITAFNKQRRSIKTAAKSLSRQLSASTASAASVRSNDSSWLIHVDRVDDRMSPSAREHPLPSPLPRLSPTNTPVPPIGINATQTASPPPPPPPAKALPTEYEIHVARGSKTSALGFVETRPECSLADLRSLIVSELDSVPKTFVFLRRYGAELVPVGSRQEATKTLADALDKGAVTIRDESAV